MKAFLKKGFNFKKFKNSLKEKGNNCISMCRPVNLVPSSLLNKEAFEPVIITLFPLSTRYLINMGRSKNKFFLLHLPHT